MQSTSSYAYCLCNISVTATAASMTQQIMPKQKHSDSHSNISAAVACTTAKTKQGRGLKHRIVANLNATSLQMHSIHTKSSHDTAEFPHLTRSLNVRMAGQIEHIK
jgi:hypothetical protein